ncbi:hypothetical protein [Margalitia shackletonii]|uniref:hypothetical protein n=1 Tax=Heyndrickxia TaxID=2837504 RepID=UPI0019102950
MKLHFLGTAAAEGIPNPHCTCNTCTEARRLGGRNIRSRTSVISYIRMVSKLHMMA